MPIDIFHMSMNFFKKNEKCPMKSNNVLIFFPCSSQLCSFKKIDQIFKNNHNDFFFF